MNLRFPLSAAAAAAATAFLADAAAACPTCYGQAEGPVIDGMNRAILAMIGITGFVLTGFVALFVTIGRRTRAHGEAAAAGAVPAPPSHDIEKEDS